MEKIANVLTFTVSSFATMFNTQVYVFDGFYHYVCYTFCSKKTKNYYSLLKHLVDLLDYHEIPWLMLEILIVYLIIS
jgi:hypothetical protein